MNYRKILKSAVVTEKSTAIMEKENKYTFEVANDATKGQIKEAVEGLYGVEVVNVNVLRNRGKLKRSWVKKRKAYRSKDKKKAIVQLDSKQSLKLYERGSK